MNNYRLTVCYDGFNYYGWQKQDDKETIAFELEKALLLLGIKHTNLTVAGRTDKGVHALAQVVNFKAKTNIPLIKLKKLINERLCFAVRVLDISIVENGFHARFSAKNRAYVYFLADTDEIPFYLNRYIAKTKKTVKLNLKLMKKAAKLLKGKHYFYAFCASTKEERTYIREIKNISLTRKTIKGLFGEKIRVISFEIKANSFLYKMVRNIVAAVVKVGLEELSLIDFKLALDTGSKKKLGCPAEPNGLYLKEVYY